VGAAPRAQPDRAQPVLASSSLYAFLRAHGHLFAIFWDEVYALIYALRLLLCTQLHLGARPCHAQLSLQRLLLVRAWIIRPLVAYHLSNVPFTKPVLH
jgi:hypothetical protein